MVINIIIVIGIVYMCFLRKVFSEWVYMWFIFLKKGFVFWQNYFCFFCFINSLVVSIGVNVNVVKEEMMIEFVIMKLNLWNRCLLVFFINMMGRNIVIKVIVVEIIVKKIFFVFFIFVLNGCIFCFMWIQIFFVIMMVLFIIKFMDNIIVSMVSILMEKFVMYIIKKVLINEIGIMMQGISVMCQLCKNRKMMMIISMNVLYIVFFILLMEVWINLVLLKLQLYFILLGKFFFICFICWYMVLVILIWLVLGCGMIMIFIIGILFIFM